MKPPMTMEKYKVMLGKFLDFIGIDVEDGNRSFVYTIASSGIRLSLSKRCVGLFAMVSYSTDKKRW